MKATWLILFPCFMVACSEGPCHQQKPDSTSTALAKEAKMPAANPNDRMRVAKPDGSKQCGQGTAISPEEMKKELASLTVYSVETKTDGLMHMQMCGAPTGKHNVFEINRSDLEAAKALGFREWTWD